jgi:hypothetical protein
MKTFLNFKFSIFPYVIIKRGPNTKYYESIHFNNKKTKKQINIFYNKVNKKINIGLYDGTKKNERDKLKHICSFDKIEKNKIIKILKEYFIIYEEKK